MQTEPHHAAINGKVGNIRRLLRRGLPVDTKRGDDATALLLAVRQNDIAAATELLLGGADVNARDNFGDTPLHAGSNGYIEILGLALKYGAALESTNLYGGTTLIPAAERGHVAAVDVLIRAGVAVDHVNNLGWTGLLEAIMLGDGGARYIEILRLLLAAGADVNLSERDGVTPLGHARNRAFVEAIELLKSAGAK